MSNVQVHDIVNVTIDIPEPGEPQHYRARVCELKAEGLLVDVDGEENPILVPFSNITQRVKLQWKTTDLHDVFIVSDVVMEKVMITSKTFEYGGNLSQVF